MKRWVAVAATGFAVGSGIVTPEMAQASSLAWYQVYQSRSYGSFYQVAAISRHDVWAVGDADTKAGNLIHRPFIRHFNGRSWQAITIPHASSTADWVSATAANNVCVVACHEEDRLASGVEREQHPNLGTAGRRLP